MIITNNLIIIIITQYNHIASGLANSELVSPKPTTITRHLDSRIQNESAKTHHDRAASRLANSQSVYVLGGTRKQRFRET